MDRWFQQPLGKGRLVGSWWHGSSSAVWERLAWHGLYNLYRPQHHLHYRVTRCVRAPAVRARREDTRFSFVDTDLLGAIAGDHDDDDVYAGGGDEGGAEGGAAAKKGGARGM